MSRSGHGLVRPGGSLRRTTRRTWVDRVHWTTPAWLCVVAALMLTVIGLAAIGTTRPELVPKQSAILAIGLLAAALVTWPSHRFLQWVSWPLLVGVVLLLVFLLVPGVPEAIVRPRNGARRWINVIVMDFQPSELAKVAVVLAIATWLRFRRNHRRLRGLLPPLVIALIPMGLVLLEPDLGTALLFLPTAIAMLIAAGARIRDLCIVGLLGLAGAGAMTPLLRPHQRDRIMAMWAQIQGDTTFVDDIGYQGQRAMTLVGAGGLTGYGREQASRLVHWNHLPEEHNDMVFAVIVARWGLVGAVVTWGLFGLMALGGLLVAGQCREAFGRLVAVGATTLLVAQMVVNTGMTIGVMPITGMTLPFVSAGGSSLVAVWLLIGLLLNVGLRPPSRLWREAFEFGPEDDVHG
ncbi:MAG: FtsW/RodA/SpoVE family cell cycle protein [Planctomycetes bacterium]|nr:FtsW/RodA/SpoVE family cell cycle protein [Planctomycetota bacterium]MCP4838040.1 FtsW/RodA/SpoVE family cell cycle protein [Planctomycetota bacterium]